MDAGAILDRLDKGPEFKYVGPVPGMTAKEVWEKMREECSWVCMNDATEGACGHESVNGDGPCAFDACPLLKSVGREEEKHEG